MQRYLNVEAHFLFDTGEQWALWVGHKFSTMRKLSRVGRLRWPLPAPTMGVRVCWFVVEMVTRGGGGGPRESRRGPRLASAPLHSARPRSTVPREVAPVRRSRHSLEPHGKLTQLTTQRQKCFKWCRIGYPTDKCFGFWSCSRVQNHVLT